MEMQKQTLGTIASTIPGASRIFGKYHLDYCCGGKLSLEEAARKRGIDANELLSDLEQLIQEGSHEKDWRKADAGELIDHILTRYHDRLREQFPSLIKLSEKVEKVHAAHEQCPHGLAKHLAHMWGELLSHMMKEEMILFPLLRQGRKHMAFGPISVMEAEHVQHGEDLEKMIGFAHGLSLPHNACNSWRALYLGLAELRDDLMEHIHLENNILFADSDDEREAYGSSCC